MINELDPLTEWVRVQEISGMGYNMSPMARPRWSRSMA